MHFSPQNFCRQVLKLAGKSYASAAKVSNDLKIVVLHATRSNARNATDCTCWLNIP